MKRSEYLEAVRKEAQVPGGCIVMPTGMRLSDLLALGEVHDAGDLAEGFAIWMERQGHEWEPEETATQTPEQGKDARVRTTRSEVKKWLEGGLRCGFSDDPEETIVKKFEEMVDIPWESEELPLPQRLALVIERALAEVRSATPSFERIVAILEEREPAQEFRQVEPLAAPPEMVKAYEELRKFFFEKGA